MLRITVKKEKERTRILYLEGKICQEWVSELLSEIDRGLSEKDKIILDLAQVSYLDTEAAEIINRFPPNKVERRNGSLFIRTMLRKKG